MFGPSWVLLVPVVVAAAVAAATTQCPSKCKCLQLSSGGREIYCGDLLKATEQPPELRVQCESDDVSAEDLAPLRSMGAARKMSFSYCLLPKLSTLVNTSAVETLVVENAKGTQPLSLGHLDGFDHLQRLQLSSDNIRELPEGIFRPLIALKKLDLRDNLLKTLPTLPSTLIELELGQNSLTQPPSNLSNLRLLNLWRNKVDVLAPLEGLQKLTSLDLSVNKMTGIAQDAFAELPELQELNLSKNNFKALPPGVLASVVTLKKLRLNDNNATRLSLPRGFLADLQQLEEVSIERSRLAAIPEAFLSGTSKLKTLSLAINRLESLPEGMFTDCSSLEKLDLSGNKLAVSPDFTGLVALKTLLISKNQLTSISSNIMQPLKALQKLDMSSNLLDDIHTLAFAANRELQDVNMDNNNLSLENVLRDDFLGAYSPLQYCTKLETLSLRNNSITEIFADWRITLLFLHKLDLRENEITFVSAEELNFLSDNVVVDLRKNNLTCVNLMNVENHFSDDDKHNHPAKGRNVLIKMDGAAIACDQCETYGLLTYLEKKYSEKVYNLFKIEMNTENSCVVGLTSEDFLCPISAIPNVKSLENCTVAYRRAYKGVQLTCNQHVYPQPSELKNLQKIPILQIAFQNLSGNFSLHEVNPSWLHLGNNNLTAVEALPPNLTELELHGNSLRRLSQEILEKINKTQRLTLGNNPWKCDCEAVEFMTFVQRRFAAVSDLANVTCDDGRSITKISSDDLCNTSQIAVAASAVIATTAIILGIFAALYYKFQHQIKVWLYAHNLLMWFVTEEEVDKDKKYDGFISYSHKDENFVAHTLVPGLEPPFKLCIHARDWNAGDWIPEQIARSVEESRRTLIILSPNYLESVWGRMEFRAAHQQAMSEGRARVLLVLLQDVGPLDKLDPELRAYLSMNTYVKWGDPWFWDKLKYAMPHRKLKGEGRKGPRPLAIKINDKLEQLQNGVSSV
ncbi:protein toll [Neocloeon triangulifer]|uniref:protein toll n=1 Tax=Neocloeon triangulifer TaxID=2078957 RepID=UPI00286ED7A3|nr:protein toll [Neocloeon triangulifer]